MKFPDHGLVRGIVRHAVREDVGSGDVTTLAAIPMSARAKAHIIAKEPFLLAGVDVARMVFKEVDGWLQFEALVEDGTFVKKGQTLIALDGPARAIVSGERVALNFLQRLSGIATQTREYVETVKQAVGPKGTPPQILDTRKTTPSLRILEKYAVLVGGGYNHRFGLFDQALFKDNHLKLMKAEGKGALDRAVGEIRARYPRMIIEVEAETLAEVKSAMAVQPHIILLDNMTPEELKKAVKLIGGKIPTEASGGVTLQTIGAIARTGVNYISVGALTHSVRAVDISLEIE
jgi:nicotinate-nucleotide pyrophosphorylase (carboxylating)